MALTLSSIWIYPIKSLKGVRLDTARIYPKGLENDRRFMLVDEHGIAITQRAVHNLCLFEVAVSGSEMIIRYKENHITVPLSPRITSSDKMKVSIWDDIVSVHEVNPEYSRWFSELIGQQCRLVYFPEQNPRVVDQKYSLANDHVSLADGYPILIIGEESLADLNSRMDEPLPMNRFRPNFVFSGGTAFEEDLWCDFRIGEGLYKAVKPCSRCILTTIDQETAQTGPEPLRTLSRYRKQNNKVMFGQNVLVKNPATVNTGDTIFVESYR